MINMSQSDTRLPEIKVSHAINLIEAMTFRGYMTSSPLTLAN